MLKFTMNAKDLKTMIEKGMTVIGKKAALQSLTKLYFQVEESGLVKVFGTNLEHFVEIRSNDAYDTSAGLLGIDVEDTKIITKMSGEVTIEDVSTEKEMKLNVKCGKKIVSIPKWENTDSFLPSMDDTEIHILTMQESWLLETITNLCTFTTDNDRMSLMQTYHFNVLQKRVETLDGYRIGIRMFKKTEIKNLSEDVTLHRMCMPVFKKILNKKSDAEVELYQDKKFVRIEGNDFTYISRRVDGKFYTVDSTLTDDRENTFTIDRENMLSIMKYNCDLIKQEERPVVFHSKEGKLYSYIKTSKYEAFDELKASDVSMEDLYIMLNPHYIVDVLNVIDCESPVFRFAGKYAPVFIDGNEYKFLILPMKDCIPDIEIKFEKNISRSMAV